MKRPEQIPVNFELLPDLAKAALGPDAPSERRLMLARATLPMAPEDLLATLCLLTSDKSEAVSKTANESLDGLPWGIVSSALKSTNDPGVLDFLARRYLDRPDFVMTIANRHDRTADATLVHIASRAKGDVIDAIAANHKRIQRCPDLVEAIYYNPEARMGTVGNLLEAAVRMGIDLSHIPGSDEIVASILGKDAVKSAPSTGAAEPPPAEVPVPPEGLDADAMTAELERAMREAGMQMGDAPIDGSAAGGFGGGLDDETFLTLLSAASSTQVEGQGEDDPDREAAWKKISRMNVPQKVRMALLGNEHARSMLIRDGKRIVYMSVLKSPKLTENELVAFARNRSLPDEVIRSIANTREWTKEYAIRHALVYNPKCPQAIAMQFLRMLTAKDLRHIATSRDVPAFITRQAQQIMHSTTGGK